MMNRRSFVGSLLSGAAALIGGVSLRPKVFAKTIPFTYDPAQLAREETGRAYRAAQSHPNCRCTTAGFTVPEPTKGEIERLLREDQRYLILPSANESQA